MKQTAKTQKTPETTTVSGEIELCGRRFSYLLTYKPIRNMYLRVKAGGLLSVTLPFGVPVERAEAFLLREREAVLRLTEEKNVTLPAFEGGTGDVLPVLGVPHTVRTEAGRRPCVELREGQLLLTVKNPENKEERLRVLKNWVRRESEAMLTALCRRVYPEFAPEPPAFPTLIFRDMTSKWGICRPQRNSITLNRRLFFLPPECAEYVVYHEFAHYRRPDHSPAFWQWLGRFLPDCRERRKLLRSAPAIPAMEALC